MIIKPQVVRNTLTLMTDHGPQPRDITLIGVVAFDGSLIVLPYNVDVDLFTVLSADAITKSFHLENLINKGIVKVITTFDATSLHADSLQANLGEGSQGAELNLFFDSAATVGGSTAETLMINGLLGTDLIQSVCGLTPGANRAVPIGFDTQLPNSLNVQFNIDPGVGSVVRVAATRAISPNTQVIAVVNRNTVLSDAVIQSYCTAIQTQVTRDLAPYWTASKNYIIQFVGLNQTPPANVWIINMLDVCSDPNALGFHTRQVDAYGFLSLPYGEVSTSVDIPSVTLSHEVLEMIVDPTIDRYIMGPLGQYNVEVGDPVEDDRYAYNIGSVLVSDFVLPTYFIEGMTGPVDFRGALATPFTLLPGGSQTYIPFGSNTPITIFGSIRPKNKSIRHKVLRKKIK